tara:strand:- start:1170 stop:1454 length:285 start_codon:yes stop_codon:yes gene_type:complete
MEAKQTKTPTYVLEAIKRYYHKNKDNEEFQKKIKERSKKYYENKKDYIKERQKAYYYNNKEKILKKMKDRRDAVAKDLDTTSTSSTDSETDTQS